MTLSVIIVSYNVREFVKQCLTALGRAQFDGDLEIQLVDNDSSDGTVEMVRQLFRHVSIIENGQNRGFAAAVNQGVAGTSGEMVLLLNPDTIVGEQSLQVLVDYLRGHPEVGAVGPKILDSDGLLQLSARRSFPGPWVAFVHLSGLGRLFPRSRLFGRNNYTYLDPDSTAEIDAVSGSCMCMPRTIMEEIGPFDETFFMFWEDTDYCYRIHEAGYKVVYHPATTIVHYKGESVRTDPLYNLRAFHEALIAFSRKHAAFAGSGFGLLALRLIIQLRIGFAYVRSYVATFSSLFIDTAVIGAAFFAMILVRFLPDPVFRTREMLILYVPVVAVYLLLWLTFGALFQIYGRYVLSYSRALIASVVGFLVIATLTYVVRQVAYSRIVLVSASALVAMLLPGWRLLVHLRQATHKVGDHHRAYRPSIFSRRAVILGTTSEDLRIANLILRRPDTGIDPLGFVEGEEAPHAPGEPLPLPILGSTSELRELAIRHRFQEVIVAGESYSSQQLMALLEQTRDRRLLFRIVPHEDEVMLGKANVEYIGNLPFVSVEATLYHRMHLLSKRAFDLLAAGILILLLLPVWPLLGLVYGLERTSVWLRDGGQAKMWVLRRGGTGLRKLPLLWSIFRGELSFVGGDLVDAGQPDPHLLFKPGITGLGQLGPADVQPEVAASYDHYYLQHQSLTLDLEIILKTLLKI